MINLKDISKASGFSVTQVSRALNNHEDVNEETKHKIQKIATEMGYVKNITAQRLSSKKSNQIAVIVHGVEEDINDFNTNILFSILKGVNKFALSVDYEPIIHLVDKSDISYLNFCRQRGISGVILVGIKYDDPKFQELVQSNFPCVVIDIPIEGKKKGCVVVNNNYYSICAVSLLIEKGRRNIALISGHNHAMVTIERKIGYKTALLSAGIQYNENFIISADFEYEKAYRKTIELLTKYNEIDAIFAMSDIMAIGALKAAKHLNKKIPEDISIFGFDGISITQFVNPAISTIKQDNFKKGYSAAKLLYEILHETNEENTILIPCDIIVTESI